MLYEQGYRLGQNKHEKGEREFIALLATLSGTNFFPEEINE